MSQSQEQRSQAGRYRHIATRTAHLMPGYRQRYRDLAENGLPKKHWTTYAGQAAGHPAAFLVVMLYAILWVIFSPRTFEWNAIATLAVFAMTLFIQRANRRDNLALHAKLDELLRVNHAARSELTQLDEQEPEAIEKHRDEEVRKGRAAQSVA